MKKILTILLLLLTTLATYAYDFEIDGISYNIATASNKTVKVASGNCFGDIEIPEKVTYSGTEYTVVEISNYAFHDCTSLNSVVIPASVILIGDGAFYGCTSLQEIYVSETNKRYASVDGVLYNKDVSTLICCPGGRTGKFSIPTSVTAIGKLAFHESSLTDIDIPATVTTIGICAFNACGSLVSIKIPFSVTTIDDNAFLACTSLKTVTSLNTTPPTLGTLVFSNTPLNVVYVPAEAVDAYKSADGWKEFNIEGPSSEFEIDGIHYTITSEADKTVEVISGSDKYSGDIVIPETVTYFDTEYTVTSIGAASFNYCSSLNSIQIPATITSIGWFAFCDCSSLQSIQIPSSVTEIGESAFMNCSSMQGIYVSEANENYNSVDGILYDKNLSTLIFCPSGKSGEITIASPVKYISSDAFNGCKYLTNIELPSTVTSIGAYAFLGCSSLKSIELPTSVTKIGNYAFLGCSSLESIELPVSLASIGVCIFKDCSSLQEISVSEANENYTSFEGALYDKDVSTLICCPCAKSGEFTVPSSVTSIGDYSFLWCTSLKSIELSASVTTIGNYAFCGCSSLANIELPSSVTTIGDEAFFWCEKLVNIVIPASVTEIGDAVFGSCSSLVNVGILAPLTSIGQSTFQNCMSLIGIDLPSTVTSIGNSAFYCCASLEIIELPASLTSIDFCAFQGCTSLKTVTSLNPEPPTLGSGVFYDCPIETVYVPAEAVDVYKTAAVWKGFNIVGIDDAGVEDAVLGGDAFSGDTVESATVYTLQGVRVKGVRTMNDVKSLTPGLYIVNGRKVFVK